MPPRYAFWTILIDQQATAFRARDQHELLPTLHQLRRTNKDVVLKWFAHGRIWDSPEAERQARQARGGGERRGKEWRPGGQHADPRARFSKPKKAAHRDARERPPQGSPKGATRPWPQTKGAPGQQRMAKRPWQPKPEGSRRPWQAGAEGAKRAGQSKPAHPERPRHAGGERPRGPWKPKGERSERPWQSKSKIQRPWKPKAHPSSGAPARPWTKARKPWKDATPKTRPEDGEPRRQWREGEGRTPGPADAAARSEREPPDHD
jgi:hypothetical protein